VLRAILFDWGNTLVRSELEPALLVEGHERGLDAVGGATAGRRGAFSEAYAEHVLPPLLAERDDEVDYQALVRSALAAAGIRHDRKAVMRFVAAEHATWRAAHPLEPATLELLDAVRARGLRTGLVSNLFDPPVLVRGTFAELGLLARLDAIALSAEVGWRKPAAAPFEHALASLALTASETAHVGDRRREDVGGASALGMRTIQAEWYARDDGPGPEPTERAPTRAHVLRIVDDWLAAD